VESFVKTNGSSIPASAWIEGMGWNQNLWPGGQFPTAADLELSPLLKGKKISLARIDVHAEWVSQAIIDELEAMPGGLPEEVDGGLIVRDAHGRPTGVFVRVDQITTISQLQLTARLITPWTSSTRFVLPGQTRNAELSSIAWQPTVSPKVSLACTMPVHPKPTPTYISEWQTRVLYHCGST
jgi:hypothetical protein